ARAATQNQPKHDLNVPIIPRHKPRINFALINTVSIAALPAILARILPGGRIAGSEYLALNPRRPDRRCGSFKINLRTGQWADFATGAQGGDTISLCDS